MNEIIDCVDLAGSDAAASKIMVIGVGGGGGNAVKYMYNLGIHNVMFMACNTDAQALTKSPIPLKMQLGRNLTQGLGAGNKPERGRDAAEESRDDIKKALEESGVKMVFITAGMGGGTGTGAAPVIAEIAKELDILTVAIVTIPFRTEGLKRITQATLGIEEMRKHVDSLLIIDNENINKMYGELTFTEAFGKADDILATAAKGIAEIITKEHQLNVDFADVQETMSNSGVALMGFAVSQIGTENIAVELTEQALLSPLLNQNNIQGAKNILVNISWRDKELKMNEVYDIIEHVQAAAGSSGSLIWGAGYDDALKENEVSVVIIATGFESKESREDFGRHMMKEHSKSTATPEELLDEAVKPHILDNPKKELIIPKTIGDRIEQKQAVQQPIIKLSMDDPEDNGQVAKKPEDEDEDGFRVVYKGTKGQENVHKITEQPVQKVEKKVLSLDDEEEIKESAKTDDEFSVEVREAVERTLKDRKGGVLFQDIDFAAPERQASYEESPVFMPESKGVSSVSKEMSIDELEDAPAYQRRKMLITPKGDPQNKKVSRLSIKDDI